MGQEVGGELTAVMGWGERGREPLTHKAVRLEGAALGQH